jgi:predicted DNA-binding WGR domain protein
LSDARGRRVTPRIITTDALQGRDRLPKNRQQEEAHEAHERLVTQKRRIGPGMDRGGATLVNDKRRKGFSDSDGTEEELVDVDD